MRPGKIPVFRTAGAGIRFLFVNFFKILRASVVPGLIAGVSLFALHWYVMPGLAGQSVIGLGRVQNPFYGLPFVAVYLFAILMFSVGLARVYFGQPIGLIYSRVGPQELRFFGGTLTVVLLMFLLCGLPLLFLFWVVFYFIEANTFLAFFGLKTLPLPVTRHVTVASVVNQQELSLLTVVAIAAIALLCLYLFLSLRLSILLPVVVQERRLGVLRSWQLTNGNFWRLFFVFAILFVSLYILMIPFLILVSLLMQWLFLEQGGRVTIGGSVTIDSFRTAMGLFILALDAFFYLIVTSLFVGALGYAYKKLTLDESEAAAAG